ncbi:MAG: C40 family peptidase [Streptosporangiaceae bacterium]|nr:C40 family peptidase [Streptosporangiaceae bacterium]
MRARDPGRGPVRIIVVAAVAGAAFLLLGLLTIPMLISGSGLLFTAGGNGCSGKSVTQPPASKQGTASIPSDYLLWYKKVGQQYGVPWTVLAGIGTVESDNGRTTLPGVHSGANAFGAAGPMQIGIGGAAGDQWGGAPTHPASEVVSGVATDENGDGTASVYDPADAIAGAAKYLVQHGVQSSVPAAIFAYNHLDSYVQNVLSWAGRYAGGGFTVSQVTSQPACGQGTGNNQLASISTPNQVVAQIVAYAQQQLGKPYLWGGTGPDAFDCSGLMMMAYRSAGIDIPRTSQEQWAWGPQVPANQVEPGDLVFFAGSDGTPTSPGHVGLVIGNGTMIEAYATGFPIRVSHFGTAGAPGDTAVVGFTRPWAHAGVSVPAAPAAQAAP